MPLTVKQLRAKLAKMDPDALVVWRDHDAETFSSYVNTVRDGDPEAVEESNAALDRNDDEIVVLGA